jgi:hypothetical protein
MLGLVRVINWAAAEPYTGKVTFAGPDPFEPARKEAWTLTCAAGGGVQSTSFITIDRGERQRFDLRRPCRP